MEKPIDGRKVNFVLTHCFFIVLIGIFVIYKSGKFINFSWVCQFQDGGLMKMLGN